MKYKMSQLQVFSDAPAKVSGIIGTEVVNSNGDNLGCVLIQATVAPTE